MPKPPEPDADQRRAVHRLREVSTLSRGELDALPYGVIQVDREGTVLAYNRAEAQLAGKNAGEVIGKNFFTDVALCTNVKEFAERFRKGVARGKIHDTFPFRFPFPSGAVQVMVSIHHEKPDDHAWIFVDAFPEA